MKKTHDDHARRGRRRARRNLRIPVVQGHHDQAIHERAEQSVADRFYHQGRLQRVAAKHRGHRQFARGERRRSLARSVRCCRFDLVQLRRRRRARRAAFEAAFGRRCGQARILAGDGGTQSDHLRPRSEAVQAPGSQPGHARYRLPPISRTPRRKSRSSRPFSTRRRCGRRSPATSAFVPSISANISAPAP